MHDSITELLKTSTVTEKRQQHPPVLACLPRLLKRMISPTQLVKEVCLFKMSINFDKMLNVIILLISSDMFYFVLNDDKNFSATTAFIFVRFWLLRKCIQLLKPPQKKVR